MKKLRFVVAKLLAQVQLTGNAYNRVRTKIFLSPVQCSCNCPNLLGLRPTGITHYSLKPLFQTCVWFHFTNDTQIPRLVIVIL